jgi:hypothetical protein
MSDLIAELKAALGEKDERVRACESALAEAKEDRDVFAKQIADEAPKTPTEDDETVEASVDDGSQDSSEKGASKEALQAEVPRRQQGIRGKVVILGSTKVNKHRHTIRVDRMGDGHTTPDNSGHVHRCYRFVLSEAHRHTHDVTLPMGTS